MTTKISKTTKKYLEILATGTITESQIIALKSYLGKAKDQRDIIFDNLCGKGIKITPAQTQKGLTFLLNAWKTPSGKERKNNPFGYREQAVLENFTDFELSDFYNAGNAYIDFYLPVYTAYSKDGSFTYYYNGEINIIG